MRLAAAVSVAAVALLPAAPAGAETTREVRALAAAAAAGDAGALQRLLAVREVDGHAVDLGRALRGSDGERRRERLRALAEQTPASASTVDPRATAAAILDDSRYRGSGVPRPLHRPLAWIGDRLHELVEPVGRALDGVPGGALALPALAVVLAAALVTGRTARRRAGRLTANEERHRISSLDPGALEAAADEAERRGEADRALRLLFRAGLARLALARVIPPGEWTSGELRPIVAHPAFDHVAADLDAVAYGGRGAENADVERARRAWRDILAEARPR